MSFRELAKQRLRELASGSARKVLVHNRRTLAT
jgi:hypothetical protein